MIWIVNSSLIGQRVMSRFCAPASTKPRRNPITPSPVLASPEPVSQADKVTNQPATLEVKGTHVLGAQNTIFLDGRRLTPFPGGNRRIGSRQRQTAAVHRVLEKPGLGKIKFDRRRRGLSRVGVQGGVLGLKEPMGGQVQNVRAVQLREHLLGHLGSCKRFGRPTPLFKLT